MVLQRTAAAEAPAGTRAERLARRMPEPVALYKPPVPAVDPFTPDAAPKAAAIAQPEPEVCAPIVAIRRVEVRVSRKVSKDFGSTEYAVALDADLSVLLDADAVAAAVDGLYEQCKCMIRRQFAGANTNTTQQTAQKGQTT